MGGRLIVTVVAFPPQGEGGPLCVPCGYAVDEVPERSEAFSAPLQKGPHPSSALRETADATCPPCGARKTLRAYAFPRVFRPLRKLRVPFLRHWRREPAIPRVRGRLSGDRKGRPYGGTGIGKGTAGGWRFVNRPYGWNLPQLLRKSRRDSSLGEAVITGRRGRHPLRGHGAINGSKRMGRTSEGHSYGRTHWREKRSLGRRKKQRERAGLQLRICGHYIYAAAF